MTEHTPADTAEPGPAPGVAPPGGGTDPVLPDWNPRGPRVRRDARAAYDEARSRCPVAHGPDGTWTLFSHADVTRAALDHETFSNAVSAHLQVPNGLDGPTHTAFRAVVDTFFTPDRMAALEPVVGRVAAEAVAEIDVPGRLDAVALGARFAVRAQSAWLGWPPDLEGTLLAWMTDHRAANRSRDRARTAAVAERFTAIVRELAAARRSPGAPDDVTAELVRSRVDGRPLTEEEVVSVLRNWTGGDLGSMALAAGVVVARLADDRELQDRLRAGVGDGELDAVLDEILRIDDPFVGNRRVTTRPVTVRGRHLPAGARVVLNWTAANRDPHPFGDPDAFDPEGHAADNLVWGIGRHVCPGRPLATLELRALVRALLVATTTITPDPDRPRERELPPAGGYATVPVVVG